MNEINEGPITIAIKSEWIKTQTDCRRCIKCGERIVSDMWVVRFKAGPYTIFGEDALCESCMDLIEQNKS